MRRGAERDQIEASKPREYRLTGLNAHVVARVSGRGNVEFRRHNAIGQAPLEDVRRLTPDDVRGIADLLTTPIPPRRAANR